MERELEWGIKGINLRPKKLSILFNHKLIDFLVVIHWWMISFLARGGENELRQLERKTSEDWAYYYTDYTPFKYNIFFNRSLKQFNLS